MISTSFIDDIVKQDIIHPGSFSDRLHITQSELASTLGLSRDAISKSSRNATMPVQKRLRDMAEIINRILPWTGSLLAAYAWYRSQTISSFGDYTAEQMVREGNGEAVKQYLNRIASGGFA